MPAHAFVPGRVDWVDVAKGFCIVMVVMMHSTLGVEEDAGATGWLHPLVAFAQPFRMPDFFLIAGLFLSRRIDRPWGEYLDRKVVHFAYFYLIWVTIQFALRAPGYVAEAGIEGALWRYGEAFVQPFGTLWFIYLLPVFFVAAKLLRPVQAPTVLVLAAALEIAPVATGLVIVDEFAARFVYFFAGYALAPYIFALAERVDRAPRTALCALGLWALVNGALVFVGAAQAPGVGLFLGAFGAMAVVAGSALLARTAAAGALRYCGENSIVIYLAFFLPMVATRLTLLNTGVVTDIGTISALVTLAGVTGPLVMWWIVRDTRLDVLFVRPHWARLPVGRRVVPAE